MTLVSPSQSNPGDEITAVSVNGPVNQLAAAINGNIDDTNVSSISGSKIQSGTLAGTALAEEADPYLRMSEGLGDFVASGCVWSSISALNGAMTAGVIYIGGKRLKPAAVASKAFTASKDTYVSLDNTGTPAYSEVTNNAAAPAIPANSIWVAVVVTDGSAITAVKQWGSGASGTVIYPTSITAAWRTWTPTYFNVTVGNGTVVAKYIQTGKIVDFYYSLTFGSSSGISTAPTITLPVTAARSLGRIGETTCTDNAGPTTPVPGLARQDSSTVLALFVYNVNAVAVAITATVPVTWGTADILEVYGRYEAA